LSGYLPVLIFAAFIVAFGVVSLAIARVLRPARPDAVKLMNYECGAEPETARTGRSGRKSRVAEDVAEVDLVLDHENPHRWRSSTIGAEPAKARGGALGPARRVLY
jgi:hypothetical protein